MEMNSSRKAYQIISKHCRTDVEEFWVLALDSKLRLKDMSMLFRGTADACLVHPRDLVRFLCQSNASSFIIAHNHPGGDPRPSRQDTAVTKKFQQLAALLEIPLQDHLILGKDCYYSYADTGFFLKLRQNKNLNGPLCLKSRRSAAPASDGAKASH